MGAEPFMTASALTLVAAQRLVRRSCEHCLEPYEPREEVLLALGEAAGDLGDEFTRGRGCNVCKGRGYLGRVAVIERMTLTPALRQLVADNRPAGAIREVALSEGMTTLKRSGLRKVREGVTTVEEILRVCLSDE
jgi:type II secretory ATPase GspE/PulE/Tfp pilus assembly ATPase PilB-like protein